MSRDSVHNLPRPVSDADLALMRRIDELHLDQVIGVPGHGLVIVPLPMPHGVSDSHGAGDDAFKPGGGAQPG
jgi:hypothetical protein